MLKSSFVRSLVLIFVAGFATACSGPLVMIPGGELSGTPTQTPADWAFTDDIDTIQLETRPADPYSVNVWGTGVGERLFIACGDRENRWCEYMKAEPAVRVRVNDAIYEMHAELVEEEAARNEFLAAVGKKYDFEPTAEQTEQALLFALSARQ